VARRRAKGDRSAATGAEAELAAPVRSSPSTACPLRPPTRSRVYSPPSFCTLPDSPPPPLRRPSADSGWAVPALPRLKAIESAASLGGGGVGGRTGEARAAPLRPPPRRPCAASDGDAPAGAARAASWRSAAGSPLLSAME